MFCELLWHYIGGAHFNFHVLIAIRGLYVYSCVIVIEYSADIFLFFSLSFLRCL